MDLVNIQYSDGENDCYGLVRKYYWQVYKLKLRNYARPFGFSLQGLDLIAGNLLAEGFQYADTAMDNLQMGDGIIMAITGSQLANHVGVAVGNNQMLHHLYQQRSERENFSSKWRARVLNIVRHPEVTRQNKAKVLPVINVLDQLPPHVRAKFLT